MLLVLREIIKVGLYHQVKERREVKETPATTSFRDYGSKGMR